MGILRNAKFQIGLYVVGTISGLAAFFVFWLVMHYMYAAILGGISAIYAASLACEIYFQHNIKDGHIIIPLTEKRPSLVIKYILAIFGVSLGLGFMFYLIISGVISQAKFDDGLFMGAIQAFMTLKWSISWLIHLTHYHLISNVQSLEKEAPWDVQE